MFAFWKDILMQDDEGRRTARLFSRVGSHEWVESLSEPVEIEVVREIPSTEAAKDHLLRFLRRTRTWANL